MKVTGCQTLKNLFSFSVARGLCQLQLIEVTNCRNIAKIVADEKEGNIGDIEESGILEFPQLRTLLLWELPELKIFYSAEERVSSSRQEGIQSTIDASSDVVTPFFNQKVALPMLELLHINKLTNLERLWPNQLADESYPELIHLSLDQCDKLLNVFPLSMSRRLQRLRSLNIWNCELLEEIFEPQQDHSSFIEPLSPKLIQSFEFPQVTYLRLNELPKLKGFYHEMHTTNWPSLKHIRVHGCDKVEILFASHEKMEISQQDVSIQQPLFWVNKFTFPNLELLELGSKDGMKEIWHACGQQQLVTDYLCKLKDVRVSGIPKKFSIIPLYFLRLLSLPNLETLEISYVDCKEIFPSEGVGGEKMPASAWVVLSRITELRLRHLSELMHLWKEKEGFQNLRILEVEWCPNLKNYLVPSSVSFQNLVTLKVQDCGGITKLITHSTAKTLVQLKEMSITYCYKMNEIIEGSGDDEDEVKIEISFPQLNSLELRYLPKLQSFCSSGKCNFAFPSLEKVKVKDCPKMKMFSQGDSNTSMLQCVRFCKKGKDHRSWEGVRYYWRWEGNLNSTIQQLFKERNENPVAEEYKYSDEHEDYDYYEERERLKYFEEHQDNPSTSNTKNEADDEVICVQGLRPINPKDIEWKIGKNPISIEGVQVFASFKIKKLVPVKTLAKTC
ncbi:hypothetical protein REPUB_Repub16aG0091600 [Reevesia pubescens]